MDIKYKFYRISNINNNTGYQINNTEYQISIAQHGYQI